jgi:hypothetical protein
MLCIMLGTDADVDPNTFRAEIKRKPGRPLIYSARIRKSNGTLEVSATVPRVSIGH